MAKNKIVTTEMILAKKGVIEKTPAPFHSDLFDGDIIVENIHGQSIIEIILKIERRTKNIFEYFNALHLLSNLKVFFDLVYLSFSILFT